MARLLQFKMESETTFKRIIKREGEMDCAICALEHLKAITDPMAELLRTMAFRRGLFTSEIGAILAYSSPTVNILEYKVLDLFGFLAAHLLPGCATIVGIYYAETRMGHIVLMGRSVVDHNLFLVDRDHFIRGIPAMIEHFMNLRILGIFTIYLAQLRSDLTPSPKVRSETDQVAKKIQAIRQEYASRAFFEIPGLTSAKIQQLRTCLDIPSFLHIMGVIDNRLKRLLQILPLPDISYLTGLLYYQLNLLYQPVATTRGKLRISEGCVTIAFASKKLDRFWYVGCYRGKIGAIDPHGNEKTGSSRTVVYVMIPDEMEQGQIREAGQK